ncbi:GAF and ANTAR domain-containing protein [Streptomyces sp. NPDC050997]|uniref:GAF and ANTAR domain-containing protein n=1 Tax=Streptomyces sp. NPDC050997 TaxID=3155519 RepID=UPI00341F61F4
MQPEHRSGPGDIDRRRVTDDLSAVTAGVDARKVPDALCLACVRLLPVGGASITIAASQDLRATWCASDSTAARLAEAQYTLGDGPCQSALALTAPVLAADLTGAPDAHRWPLFAQHAIALGVRAVFSLPLGTSAQAIGTLDLYRVTSGSLSARELRIALLMRDAVTFAVLNLDSVVTDSPRGHPDGVASWVAAAEADHTEVHQAVGMVMVQSGLAPDQALDRLRARAFAQGRTVSEVAADVVARRVRFGSDDARDDRPRGNGER